MKTIFIGPDRDLGDALASAGASITHVEGLGTGSALEDAGVAEADLLVITDVEEATAVSLAKEANPDVRVVIYAPDTMPEFVRGQVDLAVEPGLLSPEAVASELVAG